MTDNGEERALKRGEQMEALRYDLSTARPLRELVRHSLQCGASPEYIACRYAYLGATLDRVLAFKARLEEQK